MYIKRSNRTSHWRYSLKKVVLETFAKFTGKHLCQSPFFKKVAGQWRHSDVFIVNFEHISQLVLVFLLLTLSG